MLTLSSPVIAADKVKCDDVIKAADKALAAKDQEIKVCRLGLTQTLDENTALNDELKNTKAKLESPLRNPFVMGSVGAVLATVLIVFAKK